MTETDKVTPIKSNIPFPTLSHQFSVRFEVGSVEFPILRHQTIAIGYDIVTRTGTMSVECITAGGVEQALQALTQGRIFPAVMIEMLDGQGGIAYGVEFLEWKMTKCQLDHSYVTRPVDAVRADIEFKFESISCFKPAGDTE